MIVDLANHLWQSTLFALAAAVLVAALRGNRAPIRHWIWVVASVKWLVPFAWLMAAGSAMTAMLFEPGPGGAALQSQAGLSVVVLQFTEPFATVGSEGSISPAASNDWLTIALMTLWASGVLVLAAMRVRGWLRVRAAVRHSAPLDIGLRDARLDVRSAIGVIEPSVIGIWRPVLLLPAGIQHQLMPAYLESVVAHELCHVRRRDNLTAAVHMVVESVFWFHPLVWWIGARLIEERERACDEYVLIGGADPKDYAEGILTVCKLYIESPIACVSGVTGSNLRRRIEDIMMNRIGRSLSFTRKVILIAAGALTLAAPVAVGALAPPVLAQSAPPAPTPTSKATAVGDLATVVKIMHDTSASAADRERLLGKTYSGSVVVDAVRLNPTSVIVMALPDGPAGNDKVAKVAFRFAGKTDAEDLDQLRKGEGARLRGTLTKFSVQGGFVWAEFADLVIEKRYP